MTGTLERRLRELERIAPAPGFSHLSDAALLTAIADELAEMEPDHGPAIQRGAARVAAGEATLAIGWGGDLEAVGERMRAALVVIGTA